MRTRVDEEMGGCVTADNYAIIRRRLEAVLVTRLPVETGCCSWCVLQLRRVQAAGI